MSEEPIAARADKLTETVWGKITARYLMPGLVAVFGAISSYFLADVARKADKTESSIAAIASAQTATQQSVAVLTVELRGNRERADAEVNFLRVNLDRIERLVDRIGGRPSP